MLNLSGQFVKTGAVLSITFIGGAIIQKVLITFEIVDLNEDLKVFDLKRSTAMTFRNLTISLTRDGKRLAVTANCHTLK